MEMLNDEKGSESEVHESDQQSEGIVDEHFEEWRMMTENECELKLVRNPVDNQARFRLAEVLFL